MPFYVTTGTEATIPERITVRIPAGEVITAIANSHSGSPAILYAEIGQGDLDGEANQFSISKISTPDKSGRQSWFGRLSFTSDVFVKAWVRSVPTGGAHKLVVLTEIP